MKVTKDNYCQMYVALNGSQRLLADHYKVSERTIRSYNAKFLPKNQITKNELENLYCVQLKSVTDIARHFKVSRDTIYSHIKKYDIARQAKYNIDKIRQAYTVENKNLTQLLDISGLKNRNSLQQILTDNNITNPLKTAITDLYNAYCTEEEIAQKLNLTAETVRFNLKHHSIYRQKITTIDEKQFIADRELYSLQQLAEKYGCSTKTISTYIQKLGLNKKDATKYLFDLEEITHQYCELGLSMDEIATKYGCSRTTINNFIRESGITSTNRETSLERKIKTFLIENNISFVQNSRKVISPKELDFYLPEHNIAIEVCGLYWHSTQVNSDKLHIRSKYDECKAKGIYLITIFEDEILQKWEIVRNRLKHIIIKTKSNYYARKCKINVITSRVGVDFLNAHHIQGAGKNSLYLGAYYEGTLMAVMSFSRSNPAKGQRNDVTELNRFANPYNVIGAASKLFAYYKKHNPHVTQIISYADLRWNKGNLYLLLGFEQIRDTKFNYWYTSGKADRKHRFTYTKQKLLALLPGEVSSQTEEQLAAKLGLYRVYDCGSAVYLYNRHNTPTEIRGVTSAM